MTLETETPEPLIAERYRLERRLGTGGVADVYHATDQLLGRAVAVKVFRFDAEGCDERRISTEMRTLGTLQHPGLVTLYDADVADRVPYLVMELVPGPTLARQLADGPLSPALAAAIGTQLATALDYVHGRGVVHRDVKPANILLDGSTVKLADFGIARPVDSLPITEHGTTVGTPNYLSPEQVNGTPAGAASDVYTLGLVLLECLTGRVAYPGTGVEAALARLHHPPAIPADLRPPWVDLLTAMTTTHPAQRPTAREVAATLAALAAGSTPISPPDPKPRADPASTRILPLLTARPARPAPMIIRRRVIAAVITLGVAFAVGLVLAATRTHPPRADTPAAPVYPAVAGRLGADLHRLERAIEGSTDPDTTAPLRHDALVLATAAHRHDYHTANSALDMLNADVTAATTLTTIRSALAAVQADLHAVMAPRPTASMPDPSTPTTTPTAQALPSDPPGAGDRKGSAQHGHGHSGGKNDGKANGKAPR